MSNFEERFVCGSSYADEYYAALAELSKLAVKMQEVANLVSLVSPGAAIKMRVLSKEFTDIELPGGILNHVSTVGKKGLEQIEQRAIANGRDTRPGRIPAPTGRIPSAYPETAYRFTYSKRDSS